MKQADPFDDLLERLQPGGNKWIMPTVNREKMDDGMAKLRDLLRDKTVPQNQKDDINLTLKLLRKFMRKKIARGEPCS